MCVGDDDDMEGRGKAEKEGPAEEAGVVVEAVRVDQDGAVVTRGGGREAHCTLTFDGVSQFLILGANSSQELVGNGVGGTYTETLPKKRGRDAGESDTLRIVETDKKFHIVLGDNVLQKGLRELEGMEDLWVGRTVGEGNRGEINTEEDAAERGGLAASDIPDAERKFLAGANRELIEIEPGSRAREILREGRQEGPKDTIHLGHLTRERFEGVVRADGGRVSNEVSDLSSRKGRAITGSGPDEGGREVGDPRKENGGEREKVAAVPVGLVQEEKIL
jgi:hypothetical protein